ncbi:MAG: undecaprenyldiphospho-muramoylpentapeptide beta-N-acetylglucosaminyltransferase [Hydrogenophilus sp.]|nr:undecaprenyldiphospho-muramoylpentapeptide beta-N-acetylglucosaminyltransferase [Hydrogenophilus sp.]
MPNGVVVAVAAGGTGGHVFPALAVAEELRREGAGVVWFGNRGRVEERVAERAAIPFVDLAFAQVRGQGWRRWGTLPVSLLRAMARAGGAIRAHRIQVVAGFGGYASVPAILAARSLGRGTVIHEQNARAGLANRWLARLSSRVLVGFPATLPRGEWVGNPVRRAFATVPLPAARFATRTGALQLLVVGGSLGAQALNRLMPQALARIPPPQRPIVVHQTGEAHWAETAAAYERAGVSAECVRFIEEMAEALAAADVVVCRAGAMTVAEVTAVGVAAHFIPYPFAADDHQWENAAALVRAGAAWATREAEASAEGLAEWLSSLSRPQLLRMAERARSLARLEAGKKIAQTILEVVG